MAHVNCGIPACRKRIPSNEYHRSFGTYSLWPLIENYGTSIGVVFQKESFCCKKCRISLKNTGTITPPRLRGFALKNSGQTVTFEDSGPPIHETDALHEEIEIAEADIYTSTTEETSSSNENTQSSTTQSVGSAVNSIVTIPIKSVVKTQRYCFLCKSRNSRATIPKAAIIDVWFNKKIYIPSSNRCCKLHLKSNSTFTEDSLMLITASKEETELSIEQLTEFVRDITNFHQPSRTFLDFSEEGNLTSDDYKTLTGLSKSDFEDLFSYCNQKLRDSCNRTSRNALAIFLMKLRTNVSQKVLSILFGVDSQPRISETIDRVIKVLEETFVISHLGYNHLSREECQKHQTRSAYTVFKGHENCIFIVVDGTYLYIQKPSDFMEQQKTYSMHKHRNLLKPLMIVFPDGYILAVEGLFYADTKNNDATIMNSLLVKDNPFTVFIQENDGLILDRGFRDSIQNLKNHNLRAFMPELLKKGQKQFLTTEANNSRLVTMCRWVVESVNGRIKNQFRFFDSVVPTTYIPKLMNMFRIACAISNKYSPPIFSETVRNMTLAEVAVANVSKENVLEKEIDELALEKKTACWVLADEASVQDFPRLSEEQLRNITLGTYQIKLACLYTQLHSKEFSNYRFYIHQDTSQNLLRAKVESRFSKTHSHQLWLRYNPLLVGQEAIVSYYCKCKVGSRTIGCCAHITSLLWYLGYARHNGIKARRQLGANVLDAAALIHDVLEDSEN